MSIFAGTPSDDLPAVLATGTTDVRLVFVSMSKREPSGRDAEYIEWHTLDHRPEQYRLDGLRGSLRLVSTPACRAARAASHERFDAIDHLMNYQFSDPAAVAPFHDLGGALGAGGRMPLMLPSVGFGLYQLAGLAAAPRVFAGADVIPWRPAVGVYVLIEEGHMSPAGLCDVPGVAGVWWYDGGFAVGAYPNTTEGLRISCCYLDDDPVAVAERMAPVLEQRWAAPEVTGLLAAPFYVIVPFEWDRYLP